MKIVMPLIIALIFYGCAGSKSQNSLLSLDEVSPGKDQSAIIGKVVTLEDEGNLKKLTFDVTESKQGGVNATAIPTGRSIFYLSPVFIENYEKKYEKSVLSQISEGNTLLLFIQYNLVTKRGLVTDIKSEQ